MTLSQKDIENWIRPWPIAFSKRRALWDVHVRSIRDCGSLFCFWDVNGKKKTLRWWAKRLAEGTAPFEQHQIHSLAQHVVPTMYSLTVLATTDKDGRITVVDGNHRLLALMLVKQYRSRIISTPCTHVGVVTRR